MSDSYHHMDEEQKYLVSRLEIANIAGEAAEKAAVTAINETLRKLGLDDDDAGKDVRGVRELFQSWKVIKTNTVAGIGRTLGRALTIAILGFIAWIVSRQGS